MTNLFSAHDAAALSKLNDPDNLLKLILNEIKEEAKKGKWKYMTRNYGFGESELYDIDANYPTNIKYVLENLRQLGYVANIKIVESQFVDVYLRVTWK